MNRELYHIQGIKGVIDLIKGVSERHNAVSEFRFGGQLEDETEVAFYPVAYLESDIATQTDEEAETFSLALCVGDRLPADHSPEDLILAKSKTSQILDEIHYRLSELSSTILVSDMSKLFYDNVSPDAVSMVRGEFSVTIARYTPKEGVYTVDMPSLPTYGSTPGEVSTLHWDNVTGKPDLAYQSELDSAMASKADAVHSHPEYALKSEIPVLPEQQDLSHLATKTELADGLAAKADTQHSHDYNSLENIPTSFQPTDHTHSEYALKTDIPVVPEPVDISHLATKTELTDGLATKSDTLHNHDTQYATIGHTHSEYALKTEIPAEQDLSGYALKTELPDVSGMVKSVNSQLPDENGNVIIAVEAGTVDWSTITNKPLQFEPADHSHEEYALKTEIPAEQDLTPYALKTDLDGKADSLHSHDYNSLLNIPTSFEPATHSHEEYALKTEIPAAQDLTPYALKTEVSDGLALKSDTTHHHDTQYAAIGHTHSEYALKTEIPAQQDLTPYALKTELPDVSGMVKSVNSQLPDENGNVIIAVEAGTVDWSTITNKPLRFEPADHVHSEYALASAIPDTTSLATKTELTDGLATKADNLHNHDTAYAAIGHTHEEYALASAIPDTTSLATKTELSDGLATKADSLHSHDYSSLLNIPTTFQPAIHSHEEYALKTEIPAAQDISHLATKTELTDGLATKADSLHNHDTAYAAIGHTHSEYALTSAIPDTTSLATKTELSDGLAAKADSGHNHDTQYAAIGYTHSEYALTTHNHDTVYAAKTHSHAATDITQTASYRFVTDTEKATWNSKAAGTHSHSEYALTGHNHDTSYAAKSHSHAATDITQTASYRFVSDTEKTAWNAKASATHEHTSIKTNDVVFKDGSAPATAWGNELKMDIISVGGGSTNYPSDYGKLVSFGVRYANNDSGFQIYNSTIHDTPFFRSSSEVSGWTAWQQFASREWVASQNYAAGTHNHDTAYAAKTHSHAATDITQTASYRFVTDTEKSTWNAKAAASHTHSEYATKQELSDGLATLQAQVTSELFYAVSTSDTITLNSPRAVTYTQALLNNAATVVYKKNTATVTLPITLAAGDTLAVTITRTTASNAATVTLKNF